MGGICSSCVDPKGEATKGSILYKSGSNTDSWSNGVDHHSHHQHHGGPTIINTSSMEDPRGTPGMSHQLRSYQDQMEETARRMEWIVSRAGRDMISVRSTRGATYYNDQGFAAALMAHLQQTLPNSSPSDMSLLPSTSVSSSSSVLTMLARPIPPPPQDDDRWWEQIWQEHQAFTIVRPEQIFSHCPPIVESLL
jgi:hypothetical protein